MNLRVTFSIVFVLTLLASDSQADIYKFKKKDGSVVYTDSLAQLPPNRRAHYNRLKSEREREAKEEERRLGTTEYKRREMERKRKHLLSAQLSQAERQKRLAAIDRQIKSLKKKQQRVADDKKKWSGRMKKAKDTLASLLKEFKDVQTKYNSLATKASFTLLPGQQKEKEDLKKKLDELEQKIDAQVVEVEETIPREARKAGVPPGWLR